MDMMPLTGCWYRGWHYNDVIVGAMVSQITNLTIIHSTAYSGAGQRKPQKLRLTGLCEGSSPVTGESPAQRASRHGKCFTPFGDVIMWTAQHLHYSDVKYKRHCVWHLSHSTQCLYEGLWRLTTKEASKLAFPISCEGTPIISEWQKVITAVSTSMLSRHHDNIHTWQYFDKMIKAWCFIVLFQRIHLLDQYCMALGYPDIASINSLAPGNLGAIFKSARFNLVLFYKALMWMPQDFINNQLFSRWWLGSVWRQALTQTKVGQVLWPGVTGPWGVNVGCVYKRDLHERTAVWASVMLGFHCWVHAYQRWVYESPSIDADGGMLSCRPHRGCRPGTLSLIKVTAAHSKPGHPYISSTGVRSLKRASGRHDHAPGNGITQQPPSDTSLIAWKSTPNTLLRDL